MKKILSTLAIILVCNHVFATIRTCNNNNPSPGQYSSLAIAIGASSNGDTVYVSGSLSTYNDLTISTHITIIGTGYNPQKQNPLVSRLGKVTIQSNNVFLIGLEIDSIKFNAGSWECKVYNSLINNIKIDAVDSYLGVFGSIIKNSCVLNNTNNYFFAINSIVYPQIQFLNTGVAVSFRNCIFLYPGNFMSCSGTYDPYEGCYNNIFYGSVADISGGTPNPSSTSKGNFHHNVSYPSSFPDDDGNNIVANPLFVNVPAPPVAFSLSHNFHLQPTSPALLNLGDNANQRGIYSTYYPDYIFRDNGIPAIPTIQTMSITPATVLSGQSIQVNFSSKVNQ